MAIRTIRVNDDPCLYKVCREVTKFDSKLATLIDDMVDTMYDADGVGLAAPQIGILRRVVVIDAGEGLVEMVNPKIITSSGVQQGTEGCLSFPGKSGYVERPQNVTFSAYDRNGELHEYSVSDLFARAVFHECDHLDGKVYLSLVTEPPKDYLEEMERLESLEDDE